MNFRFRGECSNTEANTPSGREIIVQCVTLPAASVAKRAIGRLSAGLAPITLLTTFGVIARFHGSDPFSLSYGYKVYVMSIWH